MAPQPPDPGTYYHLTRQAVRRIRRAWGLSQRQMAANLGYRKTYLSSIETGALKMSEDFAVRFRTVFPPGTEPRRSKAGWLCLVKGRGLHGVVSTTNPHRMQRALERTLPFEFTLYIYPVSDAGAAKAQVQEAWGRRWVRGSWYRPTDADLRLIPVLLARDV